MTDQTTNKTSLYRKIAAIAGAIEAVEKDGRNRDQGYRYATPASVMSAVKPLMAAQGMAIVPQLIGFEAIDTGQASQKGTPYILNRVAMEYLLIDGETGDSMAVKWQAQAGTYGDDKGLAKAQTIALRTFLIQLFQIPAEDPETDPDAGGRAPQSTQRPASYEPPQKPPVKPPETAQDARKPAKPPMTRADLVTALRALWNEEKERGADAPALDLAWDLDDPKETSIEQIKTLGKAAKDRVLQLRKEQEQQSV